jgi:hypothetical protein
VDQSINQSILFIYSFLKAQEAQTLLCAAQREVKDKMHTIVKVTG